MAYRRVLLEILNFINCDMNNTALDASRYSRQRSGPDTSRRAYVCTRGGCFTRYTPNLLNTPRIRISHFVNLYGANMYFEQSLLCSVGLLQAQQAAAAV